MAVARAGVGPPASLCDDAPCEQAARIQHRRDGAWGSPVVTLAEAHFSRDHAALLDALGEGELLIIQDLDGVCMGLVRDPLTRSLDRAYLAACRDLGDDFRVLTNGEHIGRRGVNRLVDAALGGQDGGAGWYLPGLGGGGVQLQDRHGRVAHPGVSDAELAFLAAVPERLGSALAARLAAEPFRLPAPASAALVAACVLDNAVSPTLNLNPLHARYAAQPALYRELQQLALSLLRAELARADAGGLGASFFIHLAPNAGRDGNGERLRPGGDDGDAGTTDFQFMLAGAVKEVGVLVLLNDYCFRRTGVHPLGAGFNAREAPRELGALLQLARERLPAAGMPRILGVGDTVTSHRDPQSGQWQRGGSDRGFLTLVQELGRTFGTDNAVLLVDSSRGEVRRPGIDTRRLGALQAGDWSAVAGISDPEDPLRVNVLFPGGHEEYIAFFRELARRRSPSGG